MDSSDNLKIHTLRHILTYLEEDEAKLLLIDLSRKFLNQKTRIAMFMNSPGMPQLIRDVPKVNIVLLYRCDPFKSPLIQLKNQLERFSDLVGLNKLYEERLCPNSYRVPLSSLRTCPRFLKFILGIHKYYKSDPKLGQFIFSVWTGPDLPIEQIVEVRPCPIDINSDGRMEYIREELLPHYLLMKM